LPAIDAFGDASPHPAWVKRDFPSYAAGGHVSGPLASTRVLYAGGHTIEVTTTYSVRIDGQLAPVHMMVDTDGRLWSHLCPYRTFANATELLRYLVEHVPEALTGIELGGHGHEHGHAGGLS
jgi:hypothetical protein